MAKRLPGPKNYLTDEEKANKPKVTKDLLLRIFSYLVPYWFQFLLVLVIIIISAVIGLLPSIITGMIIDKAILGGNLTLLVQLCISAIVALTASQVIAVLESYINSWISSRIVYDMKNEMFAHLQTMDVAFFNSAKQGEIITRMNTDISGVSTVISQTLSSFISNICTIVTTIVALLTIDYKLAIIGIIVIPLLVIPTKSAGKNRWKYLAESQAKNDELNSIINETLSPSGSLLVKLFNQQENKNKEFEKVNKEVTELSLKESRAGKWFKVAMGIFTNLGPLLIYLVGGILIIVFKEPTLTVGTITATVNMINRLYRPVESLLNISVDFTRSLSLFSRIFSYLDLKAEITNSDNPVKPDLTEQNIAYNHVYFSYNPSAQIIKDLSFEVPTGKMYAIVGPSGCGKSTIVNLLARLYDVDSGSVTINGVNIKDIDLNYLRENIAMVTQEAYLFNGTIKDNLLFAKNNATDKEIEEACKIANIHDTITSFEKGYLSEVGNRGLKLSGGEKQRISLARAILKNPKILILDEATSALDSISENLIQQSLEVVMQNRTSIVIAHRLSTILKADKILVISNGTIVEEGNHQDLLQLNGVYKELYDTQFKKVIEMEKEGQSL